MKKYFIKPEPKIPFTKEGYDKLISEKKQLESERPEAVEHLRLARGMGDLSENGYYKASRQKLSFIDAQLRHMTKLLKNAVIVESKHSGVCDIGSHVVLEVDGKECTYMIVGGYESDPQANTISHKSPIGQSIMGKKVGDEFIIYSPKGERTGKILSIV